MTWFKVRNEPSTTVIVAFFVQPTNTVGGQASEMIDLADEKRYQQRLRSELGLPNAPVRLFRVGQWDMSPIKSQQELDGQNGRTKFLEHVAIELDRLQVADAVVTQLKQDGFEQLHFPASGRVLLFQSITAQPSMLGMLFGAENIAPVTRVDKEDIFFSLGMLVSWPVGLAAFFAISGRWDDQPFSTIATIAIIMVSAVGAIVVKAMGTARRRFVVVAILVFILIAAAFLSAEELVSTTYLSD